MIEEIFDPNTWDLTLPERRIYGRDDGETFAIVDEEDYFFLSRHLWNPKRSPCGKLYLRRAISTYHPEGGRRGSETVYLHNEVIVRKGDVPPSERHTIVDHWDGNSLNCRRENLRWATKLENNRNRFGSAWAQRTWL